MPDPTFNFDPMSPAPTQPRAPGGPNDFDAGAFRNFGTTDQFGNQMSMPGTIADRGAYDKQFQDMLGVIGQQPQYVGKSTTGAEGQLWQGIGQQQQGMAAMANRRGFDPNAARAASYAGGEAESRGWGMADSLRAQQEAQRRQALMQAYQARSTAEGGQEQLDLGRFMQNYNQRVQEAQHEANAHTHSQEQQDAVIQGSVQAASSAAGGMAMSDARAKQNAYQAGRADQDELIRGMGATGDIFESRLRGDAPPPDPRARALAGQFFQAGLAQAQQGNYQGAAQAFDHANAIAPHPDAAANAARARDDHAGMLAGALGQLGERTEAQLRGPDNTAALMAGLDQTDAEMRRRLQDDAIGHMRGQTWEYKPGVQRDLGLPPGRHFGPMAQQLERSPLTAGAVRDTPTGKRVDVPMLTMAHSGAIGRIGERLDALEGRKPDRGGSAADDNPFGWAELNRRDPSIYNARFGVGEDAGGYPVSDPRLMGGR